MLVDSHAHLDSPRYDSDRDELLQRAWQQGVRTVLSIGIGDGPDTMQQALELSHRYAGKAGIPRILATAGIHPVAGDFNNSGVLSHPHLAWLGDVIPVPASVPMANVFSIGDLLILLGLAYGLHHLCGSRLVRSSRRAER